MAKKLFEVHGHRGCRAILPENTIAGFLKAVELGVTAIEMDVVISGDNKVIVSHEPWMNHEICLRKNGNAILRGEEKEHNIFEMTYAEVLRYDCGSKLHGSFKGQQNFYTTKPLLTDVIKAVEHFTRSKKLNNVHYNIEIKSVEEDEGKFQPVVKNFCELVMNDVSAFLTYDRFNLQSFDVRILRYLNEFHNNVTLAVLVEEDEDPVQKLTQCGFMPATISPYFKLVTKPLMRHAVKSNLRVIPWTVNEEAGMKRLIDMEVDGIITDYPSRLINLLN